VSQYNLGLQTLVALGTSLLRVAAQEAVEVAVTSFSVLARAPRAGASQSSPAIIKKVEVDLFALSVAAVPRRPEKSTYRRAPHRVYRQTLAQSSSQVAMHWKHCPEMLKLPPGNLLRTLEAYR